jgi:nucleotide-binding universal stress UspA family protein
MIKIKKLLFPTDFSRCAGQALTHALHLAKRHQAELHVLHALVLHGYTNGKALIAEIDLVEAQLERVAADRIRSVTKDLTVGIPVVVRAQKRGISGAPVILEYADEHDIDLIVMGTHGRRGLEHIFLGSVAEEVVRFAPCPVFTVREAKEPIPTKTIERILVPVDFSTHSQKALTYARELAGAYDARLQLLHVIEPVVYPSFYNLDKENFFDWMDEIEVEAIRQLRQFVAAGGGNDVPVDHFVVRGRAATDIVDFAVSKHADLIVMATHGLTGMKRLYLGSVCEKVVRRSRCPVFTVKAFGRSLVAEGRTSVA